MEAPPTRQEAPPTGHHPRSAEGVVLPMKMDVGRWRDNQDQDGEKGHFISTEEAVLQGNDLFIRTKDPEFGASSQQCLGKDCIDCCLAMRT